MQGLSIRFRVDGSCLNPEPFTSSNDPKCDFAAIGDKQFLKQKNAPFHIQKCLK
ncbi:hypothetical protein CHCC14820_0084 [Bacillus paralicheniformis]|nr:hypothetical protein CHCC14820_0084 [Bacillus paralicheniformis]